MIGKARVSPREHQDLARHSTYAMTSRYTHSRFYDLADALQALPILTAGPEAQRLAATGTDGRPNSLGPFLGPQPAILGDSERQTETEGGNQGAAKTAKNPGKQAVFGVFRGQGQETAKMEAPGIEPGSRGTSAPASTCVACSCLAAGTLRPRQPRSPDPSPTSRVQVRLTSQEI
jgi:hypothetical protein